MYPESLPVKMQQSRDAFWDARDEVMKQFPTWDLRTDARLRMFGKAINVIGTAMLMMVNGQNNQGRREWWTATGNAAIPESDIRVYLREYDTFVKVAFVQLLFSSIEASFRTFQREIDLSACARGTAEFASVYTWLLRRSNLERWIPLLDLLRHVRNTIHNNGVYFHRSLGPATVDYKGQTYTFEHGKQIGFVTWDFLHGLLSDVLEMMRDVVALDEIASIPDIPDPYLD